MPALEQYMNKSVFTGRDIVGPSLERLMPEAQATATTGEFAKAVGEATGMSPVRIEHAVRGYTGTLGTYAMQLADMASREITDGPPPPEMRIDDIPVVKRFVRSDPPRGTKYVTDFYEMKREVEKAYNTIRHYGATLRGEKAMELLKAKRSVIKRYRGFQQAGRVMSTLRKAENQIRVSRDMTPGEKRRLLDKITKQRNEIAKGMVKAAPATAKLAREASKLPPSEQQRLAND